MNIIKKGPFSIHIPKGPSYLFFTYKKQYNQNKPSLLVAYVHIERTGKQIPLYEVDVICLLTKFITLFFILLLLKKKAPVEVQRLNKYYYFIQKPYTRKDIVLHTTDDFIK